MIEGIENAYPNYGLPKQKKYPLPDRKHVLSAIRFFNYVSPKDEKQLAEAILEKIKEYGMKDVGVGPDNRFLKYYKKDADHLEHYGILGQKWGVRRYQNPDGTLTAEGKERYGVDSGGNDALKKEYYRQARTLKRKLDRSNLSLQQRNADRYNEKAVRDATNAARRVFQGNALGAAFDVGYAAYDVLQSQLASYRMSEIGHQKMVQQGNAQIKKMLNTFKDTPYEKLVRKYGRVK